MALFMWGMSCRLCNKPMLHGQDIVGFSAFVGNDADPLLKFSDGAFHRECFENDPLAPVAKRRYEALNAGGPAGSRRCRVCGGPFTKPDDYFSTFHLTDDTESPMFLLNYQDMHVSCLPQWPHLIDVHTFGASQLAAGAWQGRAMEWFVNTLSTALKRSFSQ